MTTPRLVINEEALNSNITRMAARMRFLGLGLRPHLKSHKCVEIMRRQVQAGVSGVSVATLREAEVFIEAGAADILLAYPPSGNWRMSQIRELSAAARLIVACDRCEHVEALARVAATAGRTLEYYWEVDCGTGRLGTPPGEPTVEVLRKLAGVPGVHLAGLMTFPGHAYRAETKARLTRVAAEEGLALATTAEALRGVGIDPGVLSGGSTPSAWLDAGKDTLTEYRPGNYVFYDATQVALGTATVWECALRVEATVVSRPAADRVILDCGSKALPSERMTTLTPEYGIVVGHPELRLAELYEEHAVCRIDGAHCGVNIGDIVEVIPNHACTCANLHREYVVRGVAGQPQRWSIRAHY